MLNIEDIEKLSGLARIAISNEEKQEVLEKLTATLRYVSDISSVPTENVPHAQAGDLRNVLRDDTNASPGGAWSDVILANAPRSKDGYVKVNQIM